MAPPRAHRHDRGPVFGAGPQRQPGAHDNAMVEKTTLANFAVLEDNTIRPQLSRENHIRIIEALWEHHPPQLYPRVECPVLLLPARQRSNSAETERLERKEDGVAQAPGPCNGARLSGWKTAFTTFPRNARSWSPAFCGNTSRKGSSAKKMPDMAFLSLWEKVRIRETGLTVEYSGLRPSPESQCPTLRMTQWVCRPSREAG